MDTRHLPDAHLAAAMEKPLAQRAARGAAANERCSEWTTIGWLGFLDTFRTIWIDPKGEIRTVFDSMRNAWAIL